MLLVDSLSDGMPNGTKWITAVVVGLVFVPLEVVANRVNKGGPMASVGRVSIGPTGVTRRKDGVPPGGIADWIVEGWPDIGTEKGMVVSDGPNVQQYMTVQLAMRQSGQTNGLPFDFRRKEVVSGMETSNPCNIQRKQ